MEKYKKALEEVVACITNSKEYQACITLQKQMDENEEITHSIQMIKKLQKQYIRSNDPSVKEKLDQENQKLLEIPIYAIYLENLEKVNEKISYVKDSINDYFDQLIKQKSQ